MVLTHEHGAKLLQCILPVFLYAQELTWCFHALQGKCQTLESLSLLPLKIVMRSDILSRAHCCRALILISSITFIVRVVYCRLSFTHSVCDAAAHWDEKHRCTGGWILTECINGYKGPLKDDFDQSVIGLLELGQFFQHFEDVFRLRCCKAMLPSLQEIAVGLLLLVGPFLARFVAFLLGADRQLNVLTQVFIRKFVSSDGDRSIL